MAVTSLFSGVPLFGLPDSFQVQFTDESTGSPTHWWWSFGDGQTSEEQHPLHTYSGGFGDEFTVSLKAFKGGATNSHGSLNQYKHKQKSGNTFSTTEEAFDSLVAASFTPVTFSTELKAWYISDGKGTDEEAPLYQAGIHQPTATLSIPASGGAGPSVFRLVFISTEIGELQEGEIVTSLGGSYIAGGPSGQFFDVTDFDGQDIEFQPIINFITITPPQAPFELAGVGCKATLKEIETASPDDIDILIKTDYISFGAPPVAAFTANPQSGSNPLSVQFENLSTPALGLPTTYSWKKRLTGSEDPFEEFSTEENPIETFDK
jgi:PKD repeat protein